jgi:RNA polymerase sigma factor (sigma-70 family)
MAELMTDRELLSEYTELGSESAFGLLVERHLNLVFATALRGLNDTGAAQEITQNVFIGLARKAVWLRGETSIAAWLHKAALMEVRSWWRGELRRQRREQAAVELGTLMNDKDSVLKALVGELDEGLLGLRETDRQALILRYLEGRSHREIGHLIGAREDAVRMRVNKALDRLTLFFRRKGYMVPAVATTVGALTAASKAAPVEFAKVVAHSALSAGSGGGAACGLKLLLARFMGLTKAQTAVLCLSLTAVPTAWQWNANRTSQNRISASQAKLAAVRSEQSQDSSEIDRLRAESSRLDGAIADALQSQDPYEAAARKLETMKSRLHGMVTDAHYRWPDDLPYVRVRKSLVKSLDLLHHTLPFGQDGKLDESVQELFGITADEKEQTEKALANYWRGTLEMITANAYATDVSAGPVGCLTNTVIVPPLGQPLKDLAQDTGTQLDEFLGHDREKLLFDGWDQGGIQIFSPGNLWMIVDQPQTFSVWVLPTSGNAAPRFGDGWHQGFSGVSSDGLEGIPQGVATKFFIPWLAQFGITANE